MKVKIIKSSKMLTSIQTEESVTFTLKYESSFLGITYWKKFVDNRHLDNRVITTTEEELIEKFKNFLIRENKNITKNIYIKDI